MEAARGRAGYADRPAPLLGGQSRSPATGPPACRPRRTARSYRLDKVGRASAVKTEAEGLAIAKGLEAQQAAVGKNQTAMINAVRELAAGAPAVHCRRTLALNLGEGGLSGGLNALGRWPCAGCPRERTNRRRRLALQPRAATEPATGALADRPTPSPDLSPSAPGEGYPLLRPSKPPSILASQYPSHPRQRGEVR